jgi:sugar lactone lactonase YvrE
MINFLRSYNFFNCILDSFDLSSLCLIIYKIKFHIYLQLNRYMKKFLRSFISLLLFSSALFTHAQVQVSTFAGSGIHAGSKDGPKADAIFNYPYDMVMDASGTIYVSEYNTSLIRKITKAGIVYTIAGGYPQGTTNGVGAAARFAYPSGMVIDAIGNIYVADYNNNLIRKVTPDSVVTTFAGTGAPGYADGDVSTATFNGPIGMAMDAVGNIYVGDSYNNKIRKITPEGIVSTFAGSGGIGHADGTGTAATFRNVTGIAIDKQGYLYIADSGNNLIRKIDTDGTVTTLAGMVGQTGNVNGTGTMASFNNPTGLDVDVLGNVYVADQENHLIRKITPDGVVSTLAGTGDEGNANGSGTEASFAYPTNVFIDTKGNIFVTDGQNNLIREITGAISTGISPIASMTEMMLYPIPASEQLTLAVTLKNEATIKFELVNSTGSKVASTQANYGIGHTELILPVESLPAGMYVANIYSGNQMTSQKVVIVR